MKILKLKVTFHSINLINSFKLWKSTAHRKDLEVLWFTLSILSINEETETISENKDQYSSKQLVSPSQGEYEGLDSKFSNQPILFSNQKDKRNKKENLSPKINTEEDFYGVNKEESFMKKYEAILQKYSKEGFAKEKYKSLASSKESFYKEVRIYLVKIRFNYLGPFSRYR